MDRSLGLSTPRPVLVLPLPRAEYEALVGAAAETRAGSYVSELDLLLLDGIPEETPRSLAVAVASAYVVHRYGALPAWLEVGAAESLASVATKLRPEAYLKAIKDARGWGPGDWSALFELGRTACRADALTRARSWAIVEMFKPARFKKTLQQAQEGKRWSAVPSGLDPDKLEAETTTFLRKLKKGS